MIIDYVRSRTFACNSSSSHSLVFLRPGEHQQNENYQSGQFGWDEFVLASPNAKRDYLGHQLALNFRQLLKRDGPQWRADESEAEKVIREASERAYVAKIEALVRKWIPEWTNDDYGVDHQSHLCFPTTWDEKRVHPSFIEQMVKLFEDPSLVVLGGNDNDDMTHRLQGNPKIARSVPRETSGYVGRDDKTHWVMFNRKDGSKIRLRLNDGPVATHGLWPELVDVKITDFCEYGCTYCYMGSTPRGRHAGLEGIAHIAKMLGKRHVFEVAIGGGEPTTHPEFFEVLKAFKDEGIVPNFTTRNVSFVVEHYDQLVSAGVGGVAFSFDSAKQMSEAMVKLPQRNDGEPKLQHHVQIVVGAVDDAELKEIFLAGRRLAQFEITLLGWKSTHRGATAQRKHCDWMKVIRDLGNEGPYRICIDTALAQESADTLVKMKESRLTVTYEEGKFSCYLDAVAGTMHASSYDPTTAGEIEPFESDGAFTQAWQHISQGASP